MTYAEDPLRPPTPSGGYAVPPELYRADEPLISRDINGWWARGIAILKAGWGPIAHYS